MVDGFAILVIFLLSLLLSLFNIITICVILLDKKLRRLPSNYPIASFLVGSALQGMIAAPVYIYKKMIKSEDVTSFICDLSRVSYFICGHTIKMSLLIISFDRMFAIKYSYKYEKYVTRRNMIFVLTLIWLITIAIDMIPFSGKRPTWEECHYVPFKAWGLSVITFYDIFPFVVMTVNYALIWRVAAKCELATKEQKDSLLRNGKKKRVSSEHCEVNKDNDQTDANENTPLKAKWKTSYLKLALEMKATKTSLLLLGVYVICWLPSGIFYMLDHFCSNCLSSRSNLSKTRMGIKLLCFASSLLSPLVYCWANGGYRAAAQRVFSKLTFIKSNSSGLNWKYKTFGQIQLTNGRKQRTSDLTSQKPSSVTHDTLAF